MNHQEARQKRQAQHRTRDHQQLQSVDFAKVQQSGPAYMIQQGAGMQINNPAVGRRKLAGNGNPDSDQ